MIKGTVKFFNGAKGFGFITPDDGGKEVFVPSVTLTASGVSALKTGQRVSFEAEQEAKGPKAVKLALLDEPIKEVVREAQRPAITVYHETGCEDCADVMAALSASGHVARQVDYTREPPSREELKRLSVMLRESGQSLARRYEPLFLELQLDDRFLSENEFLTAIAEHPTLINGPILVVAGKAQICRSAEDVEAFLGKGTAERPKGLSPRMAAMILGHPVPDREPEPAANDEDEDEPEAAPAPKTKKAAVKKPVAKAKPAAKPSAKAKPIKKAKAAAKPAKKAR